MATLMTKRLIITTTVLLVRKTFGIYGGMVRLINEAQSTIHETFLQTHREAQIYLFGSRCERYSQSGNIYLLVLSKSINLMAKLGMLAQLPTKLQVGRTQD